jgi:FtsP/CotA-like multicopper oxidase with cupredoxin domain
VLSLRAELDQIQILPGQMTKVWRYKAEGEQGADDAVRTIPNSYLGPILRFHRGERVRINFTNNLSAHHRSLARIAPSGSRRWAS